MKTTFTSKLNIRKVKIASLQGMKGGQLKLQHQLSNQIFKTENCLILTMSRTQDSEKCGGSIVKGLENPSGIQALGNYLQP